MGFLRRQVKIVLLLGLFFGLLAGVAQAESGSAMRGLIQRADEGALHAQRLLGDLYRTGSAGLQLDVDEAKRWYQRAAEQGDAGAMFSLAKLYSRKQSAVHEIEVQKWIQRAAEQGLPRAQYAWGRWLARKGNPYRDLTLARRWLLAAARQAWVPAEAEFGLMQYRGEGGGTNPQGAIQWLDLAARGGDGKAQYALGLIYLNGQDVSPRPELSFLWFSRAAEQGLVEAQYYLGRAYYRGEGVETGCRLTSGSAWRRSRLMMTRVRLLRG